MAYKAKISNFRRKEGKLLLTINYKNNVTEKEVSEVMEFEAAPSENYLEKVVASKISQLEDLDAYEASLTDGMPIKPYVEPTPEEPTEPAEPTPEEKKRKQYMDLRTQLNDKKQQLELKLITEEEYEAFKVQVKALGKEIGDL